MKEMSGALSDYLQSEVSDEENLQIQQRLKSEPELCDQLIMLANEESMLSDWAQTEKMSSAMDHLAFDPGSHNQAPVQYFPIHPAWLVAAAACVTTLLAITGIIRPVFEKTDKTSPPASNLPPVSVGNKTKGIVALLVNEAGADYAPQQGPDAVQFKPGRYQLQSGAAHMRFVNGVDLIYRAPVDFEIVDAFNVSLHNGSMRAIVPDSGIGFTIAAPQIAFEDLGTEFGVSVDSKTGTSKLHVFEGRVDIKSSQNHALLKSASLGQSFTLENGKVAPGALHDPAAFPTPQSIGYQRWKNWSLTIQSDSSLLFYFDFAHQKHSPTTLKNQVTDSPIEDGLIQGPLWVSGRWPDKDALLFERDHDAVLLNIPGPLNAFTFAAWVKINRLDHELSTILDSDEWEPGDTHFQISRSRRSFTFGYNGLAKRETFPTPIPLQNWAHLAIVNDPLTGKTNTYVNGKLSATSQLKAGTRITPGACRLGDWKPHADWDNPIRSLRGRMDEVILWQRALSEEELHQMIDSGTPTPFWPGESP